jgi:hypothetical protein
MPLVLTKKKIIEDKDGDLWEEVAPDQYNCRTEEGYEGWTFDRLWDIYGPVTVYREME